MVHTYIGRLSAYDKLYSKRVMYNKENRSGNMQNV